MFVPFSRRRARRASLRRSEAALAIVIVAATIGLLVPCPTAARSPATLSAADADFVAARTAFDRGDRSRVDALASKLTDHVLRPYLEYWRLRIRLDAASGEEIRGFLERWADTPLADQLKVEWLKVLGKRGDWPAFTELHPQGGGDDTELACYSVEARRRRDGETALAAARSLWFTGQASPAACEPIFAALIASGGITTADRRARVRLASAAGNVRLARIIALDLPQDDRINPREFANVERDAGRALARGEFRWKDRGGRELALYALERAARKDAAGVRPAWEKQRTRLPEADRAYGNARIAYHAARQMVPAAHEWFREVDAAGLDESAHAWHVRAALRAGAWPDVAAALDAMPAAQAALPVWRYWRARAHAALGNRAAAELIYVSLADNAGYHGLLAAEALHRTLEFPSSTFVATPVALAAFGARAEVARAVKLAELDMRAESRREWIVAVRGLDDDALLVAAVYAQRATMIDRSINSAERTRSRHDFALRYPLPFRDEFAAAARLHDVDPALLYSLARQESRFIPDIVSSAGAVGLMQLLPSTARWVARELGQRNYRPVKITDPAVNIEFGAYYLHYCLERLDRLPALAFAAYNAGPSRAQAWRGKLAQEGAIWVETIPFDETRDYVQKVLANATFYARELGASPISLTERLATIVPPQGAGTIIGVADAAPEAPIATDP